MPASKAQQAVTAERRAKAINLRLAGLDYDTIASQLGYSGRAAACKDVSRALEVRTREQQLSAEALRTAEVARLDLLQASMWDGALDGDHKVIDVVLKVIDRRIKLLGLDQATKAIDNAVDAWLTHLTGTPTDPAELSEEDAEDAEEDPDG